MNNEIVNKIFDHPNDESSNKFIGHSLRSFPITSFIPPEASGVSPWVPALRGKSKDCRSAGRPTGLKRIPRDIEQDVVILSSMFKDLQTLVQQQNETLDIIENNINTTDLTILKSEEIIKESYSYRKIGYMTALGISSFVGGILSGGITILLGIKSLPIVIPIFGASSYYLYNKLV